MAYSLIKCLISYNILKQIKQRLIEDCLIMNQQKLLSQDFKIYKLKYASLPIRKQSQPSQVHDQYLQNNRDLKIPHILKKMNSVEKYVNQFAEKTQFIMKRRNRKAYLSQRQETIVLKAIQRNPTHMHSITSSEALEEHLLNDLSSKFYIKYESVADKNSQNRLETLSRMENDYLQLKEKVIVTKRSVQINGIRSRRVSPVYENQNNNITSEEIEKQIKTSIINENGKKYFADLYLLKKGRDKIINYLSNVNKFSLASNSRYDERNKIQMTYEDKVRTNQQDYMKNKIIKQREKKRSKMIRARNLHWNVYYDMLALTNSQKHKLKKICKFSNTYGIV